MANILKRSTGKATAAGSVIYTCPGGATTTVIGLRAANGDSTARLITIRAASTLVSGINTPLPAGSALDIMVGAKIVMQAGDTISAIADVDNVVEIYASYLEQT